MSRATGRLVRLPAIALLAGGALAACGGHDHGDGGQSQTPPPAAPVTTGFEAYVQRQVESATCDTTQTVPTDTVTFTYAADQDTAEPRDLTGVQPSCS